MHFAVFNEDKPDHTQLRADTRAAHLEYMAGFDVRVGGPIHDAEGNMIGSCIILEAEDLAAAEAFVENDPYNRAGLFARTRVAPFTPGVWSATPGG